MVFPRSLRRFLSLILLIVPASAAAQTFRDGYRIDHYTTDDGLPAHAIHDLIQTSDGALWIATNGGLARFDGLRFQTFTGAPDVNIGRVGGLAAGRGDTVWFTPEGGGVAYITNGRAHQLLAGRQAYDLEEDGAGTLWIMDTGVERWAHDTLSRVVSAEPIGWAFATPRPHLWKDEAGTIWMLPPDAALYRIAHGTLTRIGRASFPLFVGNTVTHRVATIKRTRGAFDVSVPGGGPPVRVPDDGRHLPRLVDRFGRVWVTTPKRIEVYDASGPEPVARFPLDGGDGVTTMLEDREGDVWAGTDLAGLWRFQRTAFRDIGVAQGLNGPVNGVFRGRGRTMYVVTDSDYTSVDFEIGDVRAARATLRRMSGSAGERLLLEWRGTLWRGAGGGSHPQLVGTRPDGRVVRIRLPALASNLVADPYRAGVLWVRDQAGLTRVVLPTTHDTAQVHRWSLGRSGRGLLVAADSTVWTTGEDGSGHGALWHLVGDSLHAYGAAAGLPAAQLRGLYQDSTGTIWIGTYGAGLVRWRDGKAAVLTTAQGLADDVISDIAEDHQGNLWFAGNRGIHRASLAALNAVLDGRQARVRGVLYNRADGLVNAEGSAGSIAVGPDGDLWFPTYGGAVVVNPARAIALDSTPPLVHVVSLTADGAPRPHRGAVRLPLGRRRMDIAFEGIDLRRPGALTYEYRLAPLDRDWVEADAATSASWTSMAPGRYAFAVRAVNAGGVTSTPAMLTIIVPPFFWQTWWFYGLVVLAIVGIAVLISRWRERTHRLREAELGRMVDSRTADLANETRRAEQALATVAAQADQLRTLDEAKSRFFANVSHEFRTPLSLVLGPLEDIRAGREGRMPEGVERKLDRVIANGRRLVRLVGQLLDVAKLESGALRLDLDVRDLVPLLRRVTESFASMAERRGIDFRLSCPVGGVLVRYDPDQMDKVLGNLLGNALKFTEAGGMVELELKVEHGEGESWAVLTVRDTGIGIPVQKVGHIFDRFYQVDDSPQRAHEGTGIGLAITKELLDLHGGTISVSSEESVGTTFTIRLPITKDDERRQERRSPARGTPAREEAPAARAAPAPSGDDDDRTTVLVVEDNAELRDYLREHLAESYRVLEAEDGHRGIEIARDHVPDLVISDIMMPGMDGQALCAALKGDPATDFIPVILLTARASRESRISGLTEGADDYLTKPVDIAELLVRVRNLIVSRRRLRERFGAAGQPLPVLRLQAAVELEAGSSVFLERLNAVLAEHVGDEDFQIEGMAGALSMSRATLYRRTEAATGKSPMDVLWQYRLDQAALWLRETDATVSEVAYAVGFKSVPHFSRRFREQFGTSPSAYRVTNRS